MKMEDDSKKHETPTNTTNVLVPDHMYKIGDFNIIFDDETEKLKIYVYHAGKHIEIRPKSDNFIEVKASRSR